MSWREQAECKGMDPAIFFPGRGAVGALRRAQRVCADCQVRAECAAAGANERDGVWGGLSGADRRRSRQGAPHADDETCAHGHPWTDETIYIDPLGRRRCRICRRETQRRAREKHAS